MNASHHEIDAYAKALIECKARELIGTYDVQDADLQDIEQQLYLDLLERLPKYNPRKGKITTFMQRVVERKIANILRDLNAGKQILMQTAVSLHEIVGLDEFGDAVALSETIAADEHRGRMGKRLRPPDEEMALNSELHALLKSLPDQLQRVCRLIMAGHSMTEIARREGMSRSTLYERVIGPLREAFQNAGMKNYL